MCTRTRCGCSVYTSVRCVCVRYMCNYRAVVRVVRLTVHFYQTEAAALADLYHSRSTRFGPAGYYQTTRAALLKMNCPSTQHRPGHRLYNTQHKWFPIQIEMNIINRFRSQGLGTGH